MAYTKVILSTREGVREHPDTLAALEQLGVGEGEVYAWVQFHDDESDPVTAIMPEVPWSVADWLADHGLSVESVIREGYVFYTDLSVGDRGEVFRVDTKNHPLNGEPYWTTDWVHPNLKEEYERQRREFYAV